MNTKILNYQEELERQLLTEEELDKNRADAFISFLSDMYLKYEPELEKLLKDKE
ncbi:hypothetical protein [Halobacillus sp. KGW1]|uniref:hypothetical protein n=1 Tax=Halobacillus sp. KGW1 TaxID=1793726 RepID=UPI000B33FE41|nr:hypothetical protein [Halobacillus sp. KGW1]